MKNIKQLLIQTSVLGAIFALTSCSNILDAIKTNESADGKTYIQVKAKTSIERTIFPRASASDLTDLTLTGYIGSDTSNQKTFATAANYSALVAQKIQIEPGTWNFTLSAKLDGVDFSGTQRSVTISAGTINKLSFTLTSSTNGGMSITVVFSGEADSVTATLTSPTNTEFKISQTYTSENFGTYTEKSSQTSTLVIEEPDDSSANGTSSTTDTSYKSVTFLQTSGQKSSLTSGTYYLSFTFYKDGDTTALNTVSSYVCVKNGITTTATLPKITLNDIYTIDYAYALNGTVQKDSENESQNASVTEFLNSSATLPTNFSRKSDFTLPNLSNEDYIFAGWYESQDFDGDPITEISPGTTGNKTLYAAFINQINVNSNPTRSPNVLKGDSVESIQEAAQKIAAFYKTSSTLIDWTINITDTLTGAQSLSSEDLQYSTASDDEDEEITNTITLTGAENSDSENPIVLNGNFNANNLGTTLIITTNIPVIVKNLKITGGYQASIGTATTQNSNGGGIYIGSSADVTLQDGTVVTDNTATNGGGIYNEGTLIIKSDAQVTKNSATNGGGIYSSSKSQLAIGGSNSTALVSENNATGSGGGIYIAEGDSTNYSYFYISNGTVSKNTAQNGGGIYISSYTVANISGQAVIGDSTQTSPSSVTTNSDQTTTYNCSNYAQQNGGGIYCNGLFYMGYNLTNDSDSPIESSNLTGGIYYNAVANSGGGIYINTNSTVWMNSGTICYNYSTTGEGVYLAGSLALGGSIAITQNDVYLNDNTPIYVCAQLTANTTATITPSTYTSSDNNSSITLVKGLSSEDENSNYTLTEDDVKKIAVTPQSSTSESTSPSTTNYTLNLDSDNNQATLTEQNSD